MYSKRQLYKPAPKQNVGQKKVRKLVQGTLVATTNTFTGPEPEIVNPDNGPSRQTNNDDIETESSVSRDVQDDPTMSPCRAVPALTEYASPRAEPPSRFLDLSDSEVNLSMASSTSTTKRQQPIMVCDASHLGSSPDNTEVEVVVEYEDSPARVICHTPSRSQKLRQSGLDQASPQNTTVSTGRRGPISLVFDSPKADGRNLSSRRDGDINTNTNYSLHNEEDDDDDDKKGKLVVEKKESKGQLISEHSRGIIKEILAEELGTNISSLSLYSHESSPPASGHPRSSSPLETSKHYLSVRTSNSSSLPSREDCLSKKSVLPRLDYDMESDASANSENNMNKHDRIDRTPKIEAAKNKEMLKYQNDSDSETCSLYEYVTQKKDINDKPKQKQKILEDNPKSQDINAKRPRSAKKKPGRVVASRFMQNASSTSQKSNTTLNTTKSSNMSNSRSLSNVTKPKIMTAKARLKSTSSVNRLLDATKNNCTPPTTTLTTGKNLSKKLTSTPTQDDSCYPYEIDASSILPSYTMALSDRDGSDTDNVLQHNSAQVQRPNSTADKITNLQLDIQYARYLQALYLSTTAKKSFKDQEKQAMEQLHGLWKLHEKKRAELSKSKTELERLKVFSQIDVALNSTQAQLDSLEEKLPQVGAYYTNLCSALNDTRHQIATKDVYIPNKTDEEREEYEEKLEATLKESEDILKKISSKAGHAFPPLHQYAASLEAISGNVEESGKELREGYKELDVAHGLCSQLSSRMVMPIL